LAKVRLNSNQSICLLAANSGQDARDPSEKLFFILFAGLLI
jgi:hypothetical protein